MRRILFFFLKGRESFIITVISRALINLLCFLVPKGPCDIHYGNPIRRPRTTDRVRHNNTERETPKETV